MKFHEINLSKRDRKLLDRAIEISKMSDYEKFKHGCIVVLHGKTVSVGVNALINTWNNLSNHDARYHTTIHAEVAALNACKKVDLRGATVYVARTNVQGEPRMSKPCPECQKALRARGIKRVVYTLSHEGIEV